MFTLTAPEPFGLRPILPFVSVELITFPSIRILSTLSWVSPDTTVVVAPSVRVLEPRVIVLFASSAFATPPSLIVTTPLDVAKLAFENEATPMFEVVASSAAIRSSPLVIVVSIPSPAETVRPSPAALSKVLPSAAVIVIGFDSTQPFVRVKFTLSKLATPLFAAPGDPAAVASSPEIVRVTSVPDLATAVLRPSPPIILKSSVRSSTSAVAESLSTVRVAATSVKVTVPEPSVTSA